jgi:hypothetical protein
MVVGAGVGTYATAASFLDDAEMRGKTPFPTSESIWAISFSASPTK